MIGVPYMRSWPKVAGGQKARRDTVYRSVHFLFGDRLLLFGRRTKPTRVFGGDQVTKIMDSFRLSDDIPIENKQVCLTGVKQARDMSAFKYIISRNCCLPSMVHLVDKLAL